MNLGAIGLGGVGADRVFAFFLQQILGTRFAGGEKAEMGGRRDDRVACAGQPDGKAVTRGADIDRRQASGLAQIDKVDGHADACEAGIGYCGAKAGINRDHMLDAGIADVCSKPRRGGELRTAAQKEAAVSGIGAAGAAFGLAFAIEHRSGKA